MDIDSTDRLGSGVRRSVDDDRLFVWQLAEVTGRERYDVVAWLREKHFSITRPRGESMAKAWVSKAGFTDYLYHG